MRDEVYSWRVSTELKIGLEDEARRRNLSLSAVLDIASREWLQKSSSDFRNDEQQLRLHENALKCLGVLAGGDPHRSEKARDAVRRHLRRRHDR